MHSGPWFQLGNAMHYGDKFGAINQLPLWMRDSESRRPLN